MCLLYARHITVIVSQPLKTSDALIVYGNRGPRS